MAVETNTMNQRKVAYDETSPITLFNEDCLTVMDRIPNESIDMILCDLPYGVTAQNKWDVQIPFADLWRQYKRIIKPHGCIALFAQGMFMADLMQSNKKMWRYNLIWRKTTPTGFLNANRMPLRSHEDICIFYKLQTNRKVLFIQHKNL